jgi:hypothetical protein
MANKIQLRRDSSIAWNNVNPVLSQGEPGFEIDSGRVKVGDGIKPWNQLPYIKTENLPPNAQGILQNDGSGLLSWALIPPGFSGNYNDLTNKPNLHPVATSGNYTQLTNRPTIPTDISQLTDASNLLVNVTRFNTIADSLFEFDFGPIGTITVNTRIEWLLNSIDVDNGTIISPANLNHDAGTLI